MMAWGPRLAPICEVLLLLLAPVAGGCGGGDRPPAAATDGGADRGAGDATVADGGLDGARQEEASGEEPDAATPAEASGDGGCLASAPEGDGATSDACSSPDGGAACSTNAECGPALYCRKAQCGDDGGVCAQEPSLASCRVDAAVTCVDSGSGSTCVVNTIVACGCDHMTYGNDCEAAASGVNVDFEGQCPP